MAERKTISILGATGSVGQSTLDLVARNPDRFDVLGLTANSDVEGLAAAARATNAQFAAIGRQELFADLASSLEGTKTRVGAGPDAVCEAASLGADLVMAAIVGAAGIRSAMAAIESGSTLALANKESLVSAGSLMMDTAHRHNVRVLPVDSEHNAIFQCMDRDRPEGVARIILTASGRAVSHLGTRGDGRGHTRTRRAAPELVDGGKDLDRQRYDDE